jgi:hypothetical protein
MKSFKTTWGAVAVVALLAGYTFYEYRHSADDELAAKGEVKLFHLTRDEITGIKFTNTDTKIELKKTGDKWNLLTPIQDEAETSSVDGFLFALLTQKAKDFRASAESGSVDWAKYGLTAPLMRVEVSAEKGNKKEEIAVGSKAAFDNSVFVRADDKLLLGDQNLKQIVQRNANSFRSHRVWREDGDVIGAEYVQDMDGKKLKFSVHKKGDEWDMEPSPGFKVDSSKIFAWVQNVKALSASEFPKEALDEESKRSFLLLKPSAVVTFTLDKKDPWTLTLGQNKADEVYFYCSARPTIYKAHKTAFDSIRVPLEYFRDGRSAFKVPLEHAQTIEIHLPQLTAILHRDQGKWTSDAGEVDQEKLVEMMQGLRTLEAYEFPAQAKGMPAKPQITIKDAKGTVLLSVSWGDEYPAKDSFNKGMTFRYTQTNNEKTVMGVPKDKFDRLIGEGLIKKGKTK